MHHSEMIDLILQYEDLTEEEQSLATAHMQECSACRTLLDSLQSAEGKAPSPGDLPGLPVDSDAGRSVELVGDDLRQAQDSRRQLLVRVAGRQGNRHRIPLVWSGMSLALAASLALLIWSPWNGGNSGLILDPRLTAPRVLRGAETADLQPGDPFVLRFTPAESGWAVVVTLHQNGAVEVLRPLEGGTLPLEAGKPVVIPPPGSPETWRVKDPPATIWIALSREGPLDPESLRQALATSQTESLLTTYLENRFGQEHVSIAVRD